MDPYEFLNVSQNADGSLNRALHPFSAAVTEASPEDSTVASRDVLLNEARNTSLRLYLPKSVAAAGKLPVILYIHGGGFIIGSAANAIVHDSCVLRAAHIPALVVSLDYRLAPEHRLPAAYDDAVDALLWLRRQARDTTAADPWLREHADFSKCFIMGTSAGANIAYHLALRSLDLDVEPLGIAGLILSQPFFGGVERTGSEARSVDDRVLPLAVNDLLWELSLPAGADRNHEYCNPAPAMSTAKVRGLPRCLVKGFVGDPLLDRIRLFAAALKREGVSVVELTEDEGFHGIDAVSPEKATAMVAEFKSFIYN